MTRSRARVALVTALLVLLAPACVRLPDAGPVVETGSTGGATQSSGNDFDPLPPQPSATPAEIVKGFLDAMTAAPIQTSTALQFLSQDARTAWTPEQSTITYADATAPVGTSPVTVRLLDADRFDERGAWQGALTESEQTLEFEVTLEEGEWRIAEVPNALIVPEQWFDQRFQRASLHFFDPTARIMVPEPVFVKGGDQLATSLVQGLLLGPGRGMARASRTFFPPGLRVELSVPVSDDGVADVILIGEAGRQTPEALELMVTQLAWTLRQVPGITAMRVTLDGQQVQLSGGRSEFPVTTGEAYDPAGARSSAIVFGLREGLLVAGIPDALDPVEGPLGTEDLGIRTVAVDLEASTAAAVTRDGSRLLLAPIAADPERAVQTVVTGAEDLLEPAWDFTGRTWLVDRTAQGAAVSYRSDASFAPLEVRGVTGEQVRRFLVSRDGSRLVAVVRSGGRDAVVVSRILHDGRGRVVRATPAVEILRDLGAPVRIRDIAWLTPTSIAALTRVTGRFWEVRTVAVDGAPTSLDSAATLDGRVRWLLGSPVPEQSLFVVTRSEALDLSGSVAEPTPLDPGLTVLDYVG